MNIVDEAIVAGWDRYDEGEVSSQVYYRASNGRVAFAEGDLRHVVRGMYDEEIAGVREEVEGGKYVNKRLAARLADWAGWPSDTTERKRLVDYVAAGGEERDTFPVHEVWTAEDAYGAGINNSSNCADETDGFPFSPCSCMRYQSAHGATLDEIGGGQLEIWVWKGLRDGEGITRVEVWKDRTGNDKWAGCIYGCPQVMASGMCAYLRRNGVRPIEEMPEDLCVCSHIDPPVEIGYCDYLFYDCGEWWVSNRWRPNGHPDNTDVRYNKPCRECKRWFDSDDEYGPDGEHCSSSCALEAGYKQCESCGEWFDKDDGYGPDEEYCCNGCAEDEGYSTCGYCGEWFESGDGDGPDDGYCCDDCAERDGHKKCASCGEWYNGDEGHGLEKEYCSEGCIKSEIVECEECGEKFYKDDAPYNYLNHCSYKCVRKAGLVSCEWCHMFFKPGTGFRGGSKHCGGTCYQKHRDELDIRQGQMFFKLEPRKEEVAI